ncbi:MAG TPA: PIN domain-containing protein [Thermoanaerobaculia bacterium]|nr:PIN domain-containing protein [Thermoanaerobaculia bacterium]
MKALLDTHFVLWIVTGADRLSAFPWIDRYRPWGVSPISLLEVQFLSEIGRVEVKNPQFTEALAEDPRFIIDEIPSVALIRRAIELTWTRDPFDRLIAAHSSLRRLPLCTVDRNIRSFHPLLPPELPPKIGKELPEV